MNKKNEIVVKGIDSTQTTGKVVEKKAAESLLKKYRAGKLKLTAAEKKFIKKYFPEFGSSEKIRKKQIVVNDKVVLENLISRNIRMYNEMIGNK